MATGTRSWRPAYVSANITRRRFLGGAAAGAGAAALIACGGSGGDVGLKLDDSGSNRVPGTVWFARDDWKLADETQGAVDGGYHRGSVNVDQIPTSLNPNITAGFNNPVGGSIYQELLEVNRGPGIQPGTPAYNEVLGSLAESYEVSDDAMMYSFTLRPGVKFHNVPPVNGRVMDMDDWRLSYEMYTSPGAQYALNFTDVVARVEYPDARHMVLHMKNPYGPGLARWSSGSRQDVFSILPKEVNTSTTLESQHYIGTDFKVFDRHEPSVTTEYRRHDDYWGGKPFIERWHTPLIPEYSNRYAQFVAGNTISFAPNSSDVMLLRRDAPNAVTVASEVSENISYMKFGRVDVASSPWNDERVRLALRRAVDYEAIADFQSQKAEFAAAGIPIETRIQTHMKSDPNFWLDPYKSELGNLSQNYFYSPAEARTLMEAAGFGKEPVQIDLVYSDRATGGQTTLYTLLTDGANKDGLFKWDARAVNNTEYTIQIQNSLNFKGIHGHQGFGGDEPDFMYYRYFHSKAINPPTWVDPKMDEFSEAQRQTADPEKRWAVFRDTQRYLAQKWYTLPGPYSFTSFTFQWPWLHNTNYSQSKGYLQWLDKDMPNRSARI
jgi:ABC-type transport system substrate-binding protein